MQRLSPIPTGLGHVTLIYWLIPPMAGRNRVKEDFLLFPKTSFNWKTTSLTHTALFLNLSMIVIFSLSRLSRVMFRYIKGFFLHFSPICLRTCELEALRNNSRESLLVSRWIRSRCWKQGVLSNCLELTQESALIKLFSILLGWKSDCFLTNSQFILWYW